MEIDCNIYFIGGGINGMTIRNIRNDLEGERTHSLSKSKFSRGSYMNDSKFLNPSPQDSFF